MVWAVCWWLWGSFVVAPVAAAAIVGGMLMIRKARAGFVPRLAWMWSSKNGLIVTVDGDTDVGLLALPGW